MRTAGIVLTEISQLDSDSNIGDVHSFSSSLGGDWPNPLTISFAEEVCLSLLKEGRGSWGKYIFIKINNLIDFVVYRPILIGTNTPKLSRVHNYPSPGSAGFLPIGDRSGEELP